MSVNTLTFSVFFGRALASIRLQRGLKRKDLVATTAVSSAYLAEIENGDKLPSIPCLQRLADALNVKPSALLALAESLQEKHQRGDIE